MAKRSSTETKNLSESHINNKKAFSSELNRYLKKVKMLIFSEQDLKIASNVVVMKEIATKTNRSCPSLLVGFKQNLIHQ